MEIDKIRQINPGIVKPDGTIQSFKEQVFDLIYGNYNMDYPMIISRNSEYLTYLGNTDGERPVLINPKKMIRIQTEHLLTIPELAELEGYLKRSALSFDSLAHETSRVIVIDKLDDAGDQVIAACRLDAMSTYLSVNQITSVYGKENFGSLVERTFEADRYFYCNEKTETFVKTPWLQLPDRLTNALSIMNYKGSFNKSQVEMFEREQNSGKETSSVTIRIPSALCREWIHPIENTKYLAVTMPPATVVRGIPAEGARIYLSYAENEIRNEDDTHTVTVTIPQNQDVKLNKEGWHERVDADWLRSVFTSEYITKFQKERRTEERIIDAEKESGKADAGVELS